MIYMHTCIHAYTYTCTNSFLRRYKKDIIFQTLLTKRKERVARSAAAALRRGAPRCGAKRRGAPKRHRFSIRNTLSPSRSKKKHFSLIKNTLFSVAHYKKTHSDNKHISFSVARYENTLLSNKAYNCLTFFVFPSIFPVSCVALRCMFPKIILSIKNPSGRHSYIYIYRRSSGPPYIHIRARLRRARICIHQ